MEVLSDTCQPELPALPDPGYVIPSRGVFLNVSLSNRASGRGYCQYSQCRVATT
jgi:hypothetical protein